MVKSWKTFEETVRRLASSIWGRECRPIHIGGVDVDGAIDVAPDLSIFIEMTERRDLNKVREDVNKLRTAKAAVIQSGKFARCYCVVDGSVTRSMVEAGEPHQISVLSMEGFSRIFFDFEIYRANRNRLPFGSAINPLTGAKDEKRYVEVSYQIEGTSKEVDVNKICERLRDGARIVLLGEYGTGKSRCINETFKSLSKEATALQSYPLAIDLRECWGVKRGIELIRRHLDDTGNSDLHAAAIRALTADSLIILIDGFDEIGSQAWSNDSDKLRAIRAKSLEGVKDLISRTKGGVLVSGREHYFNNNSEMFSALGVSPADTLVLRCKTEFTQKETEEFFERLESDITVPEWLPRRPLICQAMSDLSADELDQMFGVGRDEIEFLDHFIKVICERDARIHVSFDAETIERILGVLSRVTRFRPANVGPITLSDVQAAFEAVVGQTPVEDASAMLQRLPALGRVKSESNDRQFIDTYILDGLRGKDVIQIVRGDESARRSVLQMRYANPLGELGQRIISRGMDKKTEEFFQFARRCFDNENTVLGCDIVGSLLKSEDESYDFHGLEIVDGHFIHFDMSKTLPVNLLIRESVFGDLILPSVPPPKTRVVNCLADKILGVSSAAALPSWIVGTAADQYDSVESVSRIRQIGLAPAHEILVAVVRKTFFQKGAGRKEEALLRGLNRFVAQSKIDSVLSLLMAEGALSRFKGDEGWVYTPNRGMAGRMKAMLYELRVSQDPIWKKVAEL